ncbi:MAG: adenosylmethionine decarboxylase [Chloroflexi bacterium]|nr:adenosylmethionine decarboxylase [Chloroflexota bacterium]MDA1228364.1 adenosylmethionine decarboxylase [Chloroflexota bacterium]
MNARFTSLGTHLLLELKECNPDILDDMDLIRQAMMGAAIEAGATIVGETFHKFSPVGVTGVVAIAESHICIHTWPEYQYAAADIFTCGEDFKPYDAAKLIVERLQCKDPSISEVQRGVIPQVASTPV